MIGLHAADRTLPRGDLITDFAYNPLKASLYASTVSGNVVMWRLVGTQVRVCRLIVVEPCVCVGGGVSWCGLGPLILRVDVGL